MNKRKRVLAIFSQLPFPHIDGNRQKVFIHIGILSKKYDLDVVIITNEKPNTESIEFLEEKCKSFKIFFFPKWRSYLNLVQCLFNELPLQVAYYYFKSVQIYIGQKSKNVDFLFCNLIRTTKYVENIKMPKFLDMVDSISTNYKNSKDIVSSPFWKVIYNFEYKRLHKYEKDCIKRFDITYLVNREEQLNWQAEAQKDVTWLPNGVKPMLFTYDTFDNIYSNSVAFIGRLDYQPNIDAIFWFLKNTLPHLKNNITFVIIGANPTNKLLRYAKGKINIQITGFIDDPYIILNSCIAIVSPMQTGAGMQNKVLEGMALGKFNITSTLAAKPILGAIDKKNIFIEDDGKKMADCINNLQNNFNDYLEVGANAKKLIMENFTWDKFESKIVSSIENQLNHSKIP